MQTPVASADRQRQAPTKPETDCRNGAPGDGCYEQLMWVISKGIVEHPAWYPGLTTSSSLYDIQKFVHLQHPPPTVCPAPCKTVQVLVKAADADGDSDDGELSGSQASVDDGDREEEGMGSDLGA